MTDLSCAKVLLINDLITHIYLLTLTTCPNKRLSLYLGFTLR